MQGARDFAGQCQRAGLSYVFALPEKNFSEPSPLPTLAKRAAAVITELWSLSPLRHWMEQLAATLTLPLQAVDSATVVPMRFSPKAFTRAFAFREHIAKEWPKRLGLPWPPLPKVLHYHGNLPFKPLSLETLDAESLGVCLLNLRADHSVPAVLETVGGSAAGECPLASF